MEQLLFLFIFSLLLIHEMDAVRTKEWRMFIILKDMKDETAHRVFTIIHLPLYLCALYALSIGGTASYVLKIIIDAFLIGHAALHYAFRNHSGNGFESGFSKTIIYGAATLAVLHFCLLFVE